MTHRITTAAGAVGVSMLAACTTPAAEAGRATARPNESITPTETCAAESVAATAVRTARDVVYATRDGQPLRFDVAWSEAGVPAPLVLLLHGGGWSGGTHRSLEGEMLALARRGYTAATIEYRLTQAGRNVFPAAALDVRCALRTLRARAGDYHAAPDRVAVMGYSAGGHLASLLGVAHDVRALGAGECDIGGDDAPVQAVVSYAGPQDLRVPERYTREQARIVTNFLGVWPGDDPAVASLASPIVHAGAGDPPFLLVHGSRDDLVPVNHARRMAATLRDAGTPATVLELRREGHGFVGFVASRDATVRCTVDAFLSRWIGRSAPRTGARAGSRTAPPEPAQPISGTS